MKKLISAGLLSALFLTAAAQHEADKWYFGTLANIDFSSGAPVAGSGPMNTSEGCSAVSTPAGSLLFFTDGVSVWDRTSAVMPNGTGLMGSVSSTQSALIVPPPVSNAPYYIFTTGADGGSLRYSLVDMSLNGGFGDVTATKNVLLADTMDEKIAAIQDPGGDYWIVAHKWGTDAFHAYHLTSSGLQPPVISHSGTVHSNSTFQNTYGQMKFNNCGDRLALAVGYQNLVEVFDFNSATGVVSNPISLPMPDHVYGVEFSPGSSLLYLTCYDVAGTLLQYNVSLATQPLIAASRTPLSVTADLYGLQLGPDGKIYVSRSFGSSYLGVISSPDTPGSGCSYNENGFDLDPGFMGINGALDMPGFNQTFLKTALGVSCPITTSINETDQRLFNLYPNPSNESFTIDAEGYDALVSIYDSRGKLLQQNANVNGKLIFGQSFSPGIYFIMVSSKGNTWSRKIIKE